MIKKLSYRKPKKNTSEQYSISINQGIIKDMGISLNDRTVKVNYDTLSKSITISKV